MTVGQQVTVEWVDDFTEESFNPDNNEGRTVQFALDGQGYEIDLTNENIRKLMDLLEPYVKVGRRVRVTQAPSSSRRSRAKAGSSEPTSIDPDDLQAMRHWAREQGIPVADKGRVPQAIREAYRESLIDAG